jgi:protein phosphatase
MTIIERLRYSAVSHIGLKRTRNEDAHAVYDSTSVIPGGRRSRLFGVADGMGGHPCGDKASSMACEGLKDFFSDWNNGFDAVESAGRLKELVFSIDAQIRDQAAADPICAEMGTTLSALLITANFGITVQVGDSRIYRLRNGTLSQLTTDHTFVQEMIVQGELTPQSALHHPLRSVLTQVLGTREPLEKADTGIIAPAPQDRFLLSSDGLHDLVALETIEKILAAGQSPQKSVERLLQAALQNGGKDNVTAIVVHL